MPKPLIVYQVQVGYVCIPYESIDYLSQRGSLIDAYTTFHLRSGRMIQTNHDWAKAVAWFQSITDDTTNHHTLTEVVPYDAPEWAILVERLLTGLENRLPGIQTRIHQWIGPEFEGDSDMDSPSIDPGSAPDSDRIAPDSDPGNP
jgi:hypothetical protein